MLVLGKTPFRMKYFNKSEFNDFDKMDKGFIDFLEELRERYGKPIQINSSYRDRNHNERVGGVSDSAHTEIPCKAADIRCGKSEDRFELVRIALSMGCERIGIGETFIHLDLSSERPSPRMWHYYK